MSTDKQTQWGPYRYFDDGQLRCVHCGHLRNEINDGHTPICSWARPPLEGGS